MIEERGSLMFVKSKPLPIHTRIWQNAGLDFLLINDEQRKAELKIKAKPEQVSLKAESLYQHVTLTGQAQAKEARQSEQKTSKKPIKEYTASPRSSEEARELSDNEAALDAQGVQNPNLPEIVKDFAWNEAWTKLYSKIALSQEPKIAWTYAGLHDDVLKNTYSNAHRKDVLVDLVKNLNYKKSGVNVFVPFDVAENAGQVMVDIKNKDALFFWSALYRLKVKVLFVFGEQARDALLLKKTRRYTSFIHNAHAFYKVYYLPDLKELSEKSERDTLLTYINQQLQSIGI